jgi:uncharacterized repeat protein (TIGR03837 family)
MGCGLCRLDNRPMRWDVFCRVIDNFGDIGVSWRLAADLGARGEQVRLWIDDPAPLAWMAPQGAPGVEVWSWQEPPQDTEPGDVVVETFGCDPPPGFVRRMAARPPVWINLEYLSAEDYVERSHRLPSPQLQGPGQGLTKWFFYPGFTPRTGGLLREAGLLAAQQAFDRGAWLAARTAPPPAGERVVSLFAYADAPLDALFDRLADAPTLLLLAAGAAQGPALERLAARHDPLLRSHALPWLSQADYDRLLWAADLNFARGEDSIVRAMWAGRPFVWQIYTQHDGAHSAKLDALLDRMAAPPGLRVLWRAWNGLGPWPAGLPPAPAWQAAVRAWRDSLLAQADLTTQLLGFVADKG